MFLFKDELHKRKIKKLEERLVNAEAANSSLQRKCDAHVNVKSNLENEVKIYKHSKLAASLNYSDVISSLKSSLLQLDQKELLLSKQKKEQKRTVRKYQTQISQERNVNEQLVEKVKEQMDEKVKYSIVGHENSFCWA